MGGAGSQPALPGTLGAETGSSGPSAGQSHSRRSWGCWLAPIPPPGAAAPVPGVFPADSKRRPQPADPDCGGRQRAPTPPARGGQKAETARPRQTGQPVRWPGAPPPNRPLPAAATLASPHLFGCRDPGRLPSIPKLQPGRQRLWPHSKQFGTSHLDVAIGPPPYCEAPGPKFRPDEKTHTFVLGA